VVAPLAQGGAGACHRTRGLACVFEFSREDVGHQGFGGRV